METVSDWKLIAKNLERRLEKLKIDFADYIKQQEQYNAIVRLQLAEAQSNLRKKDWIIARKEEEIDALIRDSKE